MERAFMLLTKEWFAEQELERAALKAENERLIHHLRETTARLATVTAELEALQRVMLETDRAVPLEPPNAAPSSPTDFSDGLTQVSEPEEIAEPVQLVETAPPLERLTPSPNKRARSISPPATPPRKQPRAASTILEPSADDSGTVFEPRSLRWQAEERHTRDVRDKLYNGVDVDLTRHPIAQRQWILEDFKVNPAHNHNVAHAYLFVLRGNAKKACAHGTDCVSCANFYRLAGEGVVPTRPKWDGSNTSHVMVERTSRHQDRWQRPASPPGFNDPEFASTQQTGLDREESLRLVRKRTQERLVEAINQGKYLFKIELLNSVVAAQCFVCDAVSYRTVV